MDYVDSKPMIPPAIAKVIAALEAIELRCEHYDQYERDWNRIIGNIAAEALADLKQWAETQKQVIWFHGTTKENMAVIRRTGFNEGTYFAAHAEDALAFGGPCIAEVRVEWERASLDGWQIVAANRIPATAIQKVYSVEIIQSAGEGVGTVAAPSAALRASPSEACTAAPPADAASDPDAVARADKIVSLWEEYNCAELPEFMRTDIAAALAAAEKRGADRGREACAMIAQEVADLPRCKPSCGYGNCECDGHRAGALGVLHKIFRARSQPDERGG